MTVSPGLLCASHLITSHGLIIAADPAPSPFLFFSTLDYIDNLGVAGCDRSTAPCFLHSAKSCTQTRIQYTNSIPLK